jgi:Rap1a immunity proteins
MPARQGLPGRSMSCARLFLATCVALTCCAARSADDMEVSDFLSRCSGLKQVLTGKKDADLDDQLNLSWCTGHLSEILEDYRMEVLKTKQTHKATSICLPEGTTDADLLLIVLDELQAQDRSAALAKVITNTLSVWWPCK